MLFSEPKIPQTCHAVRARVCRTQFQCSSASRKFLKDNAPDRYAVGRDGFSALQRAENSSNFCCWTVSARLRRVSVLFSEPKIPQMHHSARSRNPERRFSALQRAENSSKPATDESGAAAAAVSVLFSEPKIPQINIRRPAELRDVCFSALQRAENSSKRDVAKAIESLVLFQCSSASRKFLKLTARSAAAPGARFQCSSASRKFLKTRCCFPSMPTPMRFSALQRAENSSKLPQQSRGWGRRTSFSALQRAENSSIVGAVTPLNTAT